MSMKKLYTFQKYIYQHIHTNSLTMGKQLIWWGGWCLVTTKKPNTWTTNMIM